MVAASFLKPDVVRLLLAQGADIGAMDSASGDTPMHYAACSDDLETVRMLLRHGADVNAQSRGNGATPLHYAAGKGKVEMIELLLAQGGRPDISDKAGWMPYTTAGNHRHDQVAQWLKSLAQEK
jgi:ankyrin repeat protein